jgi:ankyrin repeat protein
MLENTPIFLIKKKLLAKCLLIAITRENLDFIRFLVLKGADLNHFKQLNLNIAASHGFLPGVLYLDSKISFSIDDYSYALEEASRNGHLNVVEYLLYRGAGCLEESLELAARFSQVPVIRCLLQNGADQSYNFFSAINYSILNKDFESFSILFNNIVNNSNMTNLFEHFCVVDEYDIIRKVYQINFVFKLDSMSKMIDILINYACNNDSVDIKIHFLLKAFDYLDYESVNKIIESSNEKNYLKVLNCSKFGVSEYKYILEYRDFITENKNNLKNEMQNLSLPVNVINDLLDYIPPI